MDTCPASTPRAAPRGTAAQGREAETTAAEGRRLRPPDPRVLFSRRCSLGWQSRGGAARGLWLILTEPGHQLEAQPRSTLSLARQGAECQLRVASPTECRLPLNGAEGHVQDQPASVPSTVLLRNITWIRAAERASVWGHWQSLTRAELQAQAGIHRHTAQPASSILVPPTPSNRQLEEAFPGLDPALPVSVCFSTTACRILPPAPFHRIPYSL